MKKDTVRNASLWVCTLLTALIIFLFSAQNGLESGGLSGGITQWILELFAPYRALDGPGQEQVYGVVQELLRSGAHWFIFFCLGLFTALLAKGYPSLRKPFLTALCACVLYAVFDELHQGFFSVGRACEFVDLVKDWTGSGTAILLVWLGGRRRNTAVNN